MGMTIEACLARERRIWVDLQHLVLETSENRIRDNIQISITIFSSSFFLEPQASTAKYTVYTV